jgi:hypothetical protein
MQASSADIFPATVPIYSHVIFENSFAGSAKRLNRKYVALFHALTGSSLDEWNLLVAMNLVAQDVVTG